VKAGPKTGGKPGFKGAGKPFAKSAGPKAGGFKSDGGKPAYAKSSRDKLERDRPERDRPERDRPERAKPEWAKADRPKSDRPRSDRPKPDWAKSDQAKPDRPRAAVARTAAPRTDAPRTVAPTETPMLASAIAEPAAMDGAEGERIAKALARAGVASRREVERYIADGRVAVNGRVLTSPAVKIALGDVLTVDGAVINEAEPTRLWRYHKPVGLLTTHNDPNGRPTVFENLPEGLPRVISVGRLDINSEGLLLLTNDGSLARALELPKSGWIRRYRVRAFGRTDQKKLDDLSKGVVVEGVAYGPIEARLDKVTRTESAGGSNIWITVAISEGKNREVRRVMESVSLKVNRLIRLAYGPFALGTLPSGAAEEVGPRVIRELLSDFIAPENMPRGERIAGPVLTPAGRFRRNPDKGPEGAAVRKAAAKSEASAKPKKAYKAGWAKPAPKKVVAKVGKPRAITSKAAGPRSAAPKGPKKR